MKKKIIIALIAIVAVYACVSYVMGGLLIGFGHGHAIVYRSYCSDLCPQNKQWFATYYPLPLQANCTELGARPLIDPAFRAYIGCSPF